MCVAAGRSPGGTGPERLRRGVPCPEERAVRSEAPLADWSGRAAHAEALLCTLPWIDRTRCFVWDLQLDSRLLTLISP